MTRGSKRACYYCGMPPNGSDDPVPPEALFRGVSGRDYKTPCVITVPSCVIHNEDQAAADETFAWIMSDSGSLQSDAARDVYQSLLSGVSNRFWKDRGFYDERLAHSGVRILRNPGDYDDRGNPRRIAYDAAYFEKVDRDLRAKWAIIRKAIQKIAAGICYYTMDGVHLGNDRIESLTIVAPDFKQVGSEISLVGLDNDEDVHLKNTLSGWRTSDWRSIDSGSPAVFRCRIAVNPKRRNRFAMSMLFYDDVRVWVTLGTSEQTG